MSSTRVLLPAIITSGMVGYQCLISMPLMVGALVDYRGFTVGTVGIVGTLELLGMAVATICISQFIHKIDSAPRTHMRYYISMHANHVGSKFFPTDILYGESDHWISGGDTNWDYGVIIARSSSPERLTALAILGVAFFGGILNIIMPHIIAQTGAGGGYLSLAGITALCLPGYFFFPPSLDDTERKQTQFRAKFLILAGFAFIFGVASSGMWAFTERMGVAIGMNVTDEGYLLGVGTFFGVLGAGLAAVEVIN